MYQPQVRGDPQTNTEAPENEYKQNKPSFYIARSHDRNCQQS